MMIVVNINESLPITSLKVSELKKTNGILPDFKNSSIATVTRYSNDNSKCSVVYQITKKYQNNFGKRGIQGPLMASMMLTVPTKPTKFKSLMDILFISSLQIISKYSLNI